MNIPPKNVLNFFQNFYRFFSYVIIQFFRNQCVSSAAALSYTSLLALVPLLSLSFAILSSFSSLQNIQQYILNYLFSHLLLDSSNIFVENLTHFISNTQHLDVLGTLLLLFSITFVFTTIEKTFNIIWSVNYPRPFFQRVLSFWALITLGPLLAGLGINIFLSLAVEVSHQAHIFHLHLENGIKFLLPMFILVIVFTLIYLIVPNHKVKFTHALLGAILSSIALEICRHLFLTYITYLPSYQFIYKTLSTLPLFIVWMYVFWGLVLFGAQIVSSLPDWGNLPPRELLFLISTEHVFLNSLKIIEVIHKHQKVGISSKDILKEIKMGGQEFEKILHKFYEAHLIEESQDDLIFLIGNSENTTLYQVYQALGFGVQEVHELDKNRPWVSYWTSSAINLLKKVKKSEMSSLNITLKDFFNGATLSQR